ncbi:MAG TPA: tRNA (adenosine(37)-N6)-threonylcarbamoyltransferase complex dimerization subunit type 1 TsaB [Vicinamibacteria bacterium]|nr:tRNA (adenosine(37)-N6)-threonylcarbamoyltransferase complex dimerization subunit type 1 TsaB [Vicinamibacteria bacterium]
MRVLAVDSSTDHESVALVQGGQVLGEVRMTAALHSRRLLPAIELLLGSAGLRPAEIDAYAVTIGPGSFTGLRVGLATVQGLALAAGVRCLGLPTLDVLAARIAGTADALVALMDAQRDEVFGAVYDGAARLQGDRRIGVVESFLEALPERTAFLGDGVAQHRDRILARLPTAVFPPRSRYLAGTLGLLAEPRLAGGEGAPPDALRPLYLRGAHLRGARA